MNARILRLAGYSFVLSAILLLGACHKKTDSCSSNTASTPTGEAKRDVERFANECAAGPVRAVSVGSPDATEASIDSLGVVAPAGTRNTLPSESTTYTLTAKGLGGTVQAAARVTLTIPPAPPAAAAGPSDQELFQKNMKDIYFNYDRFDVRAGDAAALKADADFLIAHPSLRVVISGHGDERGSVDSHLALGSSRANGVRDQLVRLGIAPSRIKTISYGNEKGFCDEMTEQCWQQNRRAHFSLEQ